MSIQYKTKSFERLRDVQLKSVTAEDLNPCLLVIDNNSFYLLKVQRNEILNSEGRAGLKVLVVYNKLFGGNFLFS